jgi:hypothetical protein
MVVSSSYANLARARELGVWLGVNYRDQQDWDRAVLVLPVG